MTPKDTLLGFRGRIARYTFFICSLVTFPLYAIAAFGFLIGAFNAHADAYVGAAIGMAVVVLAGGIALWINVALAVKRLHDLGQSGLHVLWIGLLLLARGWFAESEYGWIFPVAAIAVVAGLLLMPGQGDANAYGPVPA